MAKTLITQRDPKYSNAKSYQGGLLDVLEALKASIYRNLAVASIGEVQKIDNKDKAVSVKLLPLKQDESSKIVECQTGMFPVITKDNNKETIEWKQYIDYITLKDLVLVVFTDRNSVQNINQHRSGNTYSTLLSKTPELHSENFGIVVGIISKSQIGG